MPNHDPKEVLATAWTVDQIDLLGIVLTSNGADAREVLDAQYARARELGIATSPEDDLASN